jgi:hypothetical protein
MLQIVLVSKRVITSGNIVLLVEEVLSGLFGLPVRLVRVGSSQTTFIASEKHKHGYQTKIIR